MSWWICTCLCFYHFHTVPRTDSYAVVDICGDSLSSVSSITRSEGYIQSGNYPANYRPELSCSCNLTAQDPGTKIRLYVLDMDLSTEQRITMGHDWLEYTQSLDNWGDGHKLNHVEWGTEVNTSGATVYLNFRSDAGQGGRGFWVGYRGKLHLV
jgi:hypothetical protein